MQLLAKIVLGGLAIVSPAAATSVPAHGQRSTTVAPQEIVPYYKTWSNATCYGDVYAVGRLLPFQTEPPLDGDNITVQICLDFCDSKGFIFAGLEFGKDCYCGSMRPNAYHLGGTCNMPCSGNSLQVCGGDKSLLVYERSTKNLTQACC